MNEQIEFSDGPKTNTYRVLCMKTKYCLVSVLNWTERNKWTMQSRKKNKQNLTEQKMSLHQCVFVSVCACVSM